ncbi:hypothetical protein PLANPX_3549 [Lacipirellula parvula]|uniref:Uncharacterized protein n=1 Tax=Lacipirellula parvula TaxID=2650471 RepID=A0A5K7XD51_9BACT|nr:hypothetical protein PLANPX_3549 [Lacipirellula parvula]
MVSWRAAKFPCFREGCTPTFQETLSQEIPARRGSINFRVRACQGVERGQRRFTGVMKNVHVPSSRAA